MKKTIKIIALCIVIALVTVTLCSCQALDEMKAKQAFYTDDTEKEIIWQDQNYKQIDTGKYSFISSFYNDSDLIVTEKVVPVLLADYEGDYATVSHEDQVIYTYGQYYIREDQYDEVKSNIENAELDHYYFTYFSYPKYGYDDYYYDRKESYVDDSDRNILLDDEVTDAINRALKTDEKDKVFYDQLESAEELVVYLCDKDMLITDAEKPVYVYRDGDDFYIWNGYDYGKNKLCPVAKDDAKLLRDYFEQYSDAFETFDLSYYVDDDGGSSDDGSDSGYGYSSKPVEGV